MSRNTKSPGGKKHSEMMGHLIDPRNKDWEAEETICFMENTKEKQTNRGKIYASSWYEKKLA